MLTDDIHPHRANPHFSHPKAKVERGVDFRGAGGGFDGVGSVLRIGRHCQWDRLSWQLYFFAIRGHDASWQRGLLSSLCAALGFLGELQPLDARRA
jgi:hypothetical protein